MNDDNELKYKMNFNFIIPKQYCSKFQSIFFYIKKNIKLISQENPKLIVFLRNVKENFLKLFMK